VARNRPDSPPRWPFAAGLLLVLLVAAGLRLHRLPELPAGLHYDEAANGILAAEIARGAARPVFIPSYTGKEVLFFYWAALWMKLLGATPLALRLSAALVGLATVAATIWAVRELLHGHRDADWIALLTGAFVATSFWHLVLSRYGFRAVTQPLLQALTVAALWRGLRLGLVGQKSEQGCSRSERWRPFRQKSEQGCSRSECPRPVGQESEQGCSRSRRSRSVGRESAQGCCGLSQSERSKPMWGRGSLPFLLLAGLFCGLTAYTYLAARAFPIPLAAALLTLLITDRGQRRARLAQLALFVAVAALTLAPLAHYWLTHPGSFLNRTQQVAAADLGEVWSGIRACAAMLFLKGDPYVRFNLPHRPLLDPITAVLSLLGLIALLKPLRPSSSFHPPQKPGFSEKTWFLSPPSNLHLATRVFLLTYLPTMLLPNALATGEITPSNLRAAGLLPFLYLLPALGISVIKAQIPEPNLQPPTSSLHSPLSILRSLLSSLQPPTSNLHSPTSNLQPPTSICHLSFVILLLPLLLLTPLTATAYFRDWAPSAALYYAADGDLADAAAFLNGTELATATPYVASIHYRHPTLAFLAQDYAAVRWLTGGHTLVFPPEGEALLIFPHSASNDLAWVQSMLPAGSLVAASPGPDGAPAFHAYRARLVDGLAPSRPLSANLGQTALLLGYDVAGTPRSGETAEVSVWWQVTGIPDRGDYGPVARLTDPWGFVWGESLPFDYPAEQWTTGEWVVDHLSIPVAPGAPPGDYALRFGFYSSGGDSLLPVIDEGGRYAGTAVELPVRLARATAPPTPDELGIRNHIDARADGLALLGANLDTASARPGERLYLTLFWQAASAPLPDTEIALTLGDATLYAGAPVHGTYPTSEWAAGEIVTDRHDPRLPLDTPPGDYPMRIQVGRRSFHLGTIAVQETARTFEAPPISHPLAATLGDQVELLGYDLTASPGPDEEAYEEEEAIVAPGGTITLTLYWRALAEMDESYTVFTHLLAPDGSMTGQRDSVPVGGTYPTHLWLAGEVVADVYEIPIRTDATPGTHQLEVGMYVAETGARLPIGDTDAGAVRLQTVTVGKPADDSP